MSFDIFFQPCCFAQTPVVKKNPFTGAERSMLPREPLSMEELTAVEQVLKGAKAAGPNEHGCYVVQMDGGSGFEIFGEDLARGCMVALRGITPDVVQFLFDLLKAGNWSMFPAIEDAVVITTSSTRLVRVPESFPKIVVCSSVEELATLLCDGVRAWEKYRDQVLGGRD